MIKTNQYEWNEGWDLINIDSQIKKPQLGFIFGSRIELENEGEQAIAALKKIYPSITIVTTSTAGNVVGERIKYQAIIATCIEFEKTDLVFKSFKINKTKEKELGRTIAQSFDTDNLACVMLFATHNLNAVNLVEGINIGFNHKVPVSGGIAGDGLRFEKTFAGKGSSLEENNIVAIGLYSDSLDVSYGSKGGWDTFGPPRKVTKAKGNILYEIDDTPVLDIYKEYLGPKAKDLPSSGLLFPFAIIDKQTNELIVRGIQNVDEDTKSIILYGDVENGQMLRLMRANQPSLIDGAGESARDALSGSSNAPQLALIVSCVARRLALDQLIEEEVEEVQEILCESAVLFGFYSYSEISPLNGVVACSLHNQTMTITALSEQ